MLRNSVTVLKSVVGFLELYVATLTYAVITIGLINSDYLMVEGGLKVAIVAIFMELLKHHQLGYSTVSIPLVLATPGIIILFYLIEAPSAFTSFISYILLTVLAATISKASSSDVLTATLTRSVPIFYAATAYTLLRQPLGYIQNNLAVATICSSLFTLLTIFVLAGNHSKPLDKSSFTTAVKHLRMLEKPLRVLKTFHILLSAIKYRIKRSTTLIVETLLSLENLYRSTASITLMGYDKVVTSTETVSVTFDQAMFSISIRILSLVRRLGARSKELEASLEELIHRIAQYVELLQNSLESSLLLLLSAMSILILISVIAYVLLFI